MAQTIILIFFSVINLYIIGLVTLGIGTVSLFWGGKNAKKGAARMLGAGFLVLGATVIAPWILLNTTPNLFPVSIALAVIPGIGFRIFRYHQAKERKKYDYPLKKPDDE